MAKLTNKNKVADAQAAPAAAPAAAPVTASAPAPAPVAPAQASVAPAPASVAPVPFAVAAPGEAVQATGGRPNLAAARADKIKAATEGKVFTFKEHRDGVEFHCICGSKGKNAIVLVDAAGNEVLTGNTCLKYFKAPDGTPVVLPKAVRTPGAPRGASNPGISKQQKFADHMAKYVGPFAFARTQNGTFSCFCGGRGTNQIVVRDANGAEFSVGETCAKLIPGVEIPSKVKKAPGGGAPVVAGLKTATVPPPVPSFSQVG